MQISWALIINHLNCFNLLILLNYSIFQSIIRGLGEGINRINLGEKSYAGGISSEVFGAAELRVLWLQRSPCLGRWVVHLSHSLIVNKENSSSNFVLSLFHVLGFDECIWLSTIYIVYLTHHIYMYKFVLGEFSLCRWRRCIPEIFGEKQSGRRQSLDQPSLIRWVHYIFLFPFCTLKLIVCKF